MSSHAPPSHTGNHLPHTGQNHGTASQHVHAQSQTRDSSSHQHPSGSTHVHTVGAESHPQATQSSNHHHPQNGPHAPHAQHLGNPEGWQEDATSNATESIEKAVRLMNNLKLHLNEIKRGSNSTEIDALVDKIDETSRHIAQDELAHPQDRVAKSDKTVTK